MHFLSKSISEELGSKLTLCSLIGIAYYFDDRLSCLIFQKFQPVEEIVAYKRE